MSCSKVLLLLLLLRNSASIRGAWDKVRPSHLFEPLDGKDQRRPQLKVENVAHLWLISASSECDIIEMETPVIRQG